MRKEFSNTNPEGMTLAEIREEAYQDERNIGYEDGYEDGHDDGYAKGYSEGFVAGIEQEVVEIKVKLDENAIIPTRAHGTDAGLDLYSPVSGAVYPYDGLTIDTGVHVEIPKGYCGLLVSKSGLNVNKNLTSTGLIDEGYTGSIKIKLYNHGAVKQWITEREKISQLVLIPYTAPKIQIVDKLEDTERGNNGFGSTGRY